MSLSIRKTVSIKVGKSEAIRIAAAIFLKNKRATEVKLRTYNKLVTLSYTGPRSKEAVIVAGVQIVTAIDMPEMD